MLKFHNLLVFFYRSIWKSTVIIQKISFFWKLDTSLPLARIGGIMGIFALLKNELMVDQYASDPFSRLSNLALILVIHLFLALVINDDLLLLN